MKRFSQLFILSLVLTSACKLKKKEKNENAERTEALVSHVANFEIERDWRGNQSKIKTLRIAFDEKAELPIGVSRENKLSRSSSDGLKQTFQSNSLDSTSERMSADVECESDACSEFTVTFNHPQLAPFQILRKVYEVTGGQKISSEGSAPAQITSAADHVSARLIKDLSDSNLQNDQLKVLIAVDAVQAAKTAFLTTIVYRDSTSNMYRSTDDFSSSLQLKKDPEWNTVDYKVLLFRTKYSAKADVSVVRSFTRKLGGDTDAVSLFNENRNEKSKWESSLSGTTLQRIKAGEDFDFEMSWNEEVSRYLESVRIEGVLEAVDGQVFETLPRVGGI